jgi:hypothetical protein
MQTRDMKTAPSRSRLCQKRHAYFRGTTLRGYELRVSRRSGLRLAGRRGNRRPARKAESFESDGRRGRRPLQTRAGVSPADAEPSAWGVGPGAWGLDRRRSERGLGAEPAGIAHRGRRRKMRATGDHRQLPILSRLPAESRLVGLARGLQGENGRLRAKAKNRASAPYAPPRDRAAPAPRPRHSPSHSRHPPSHPPHPPSHPCQGRTNAATHPRRPTPRVEGDGAAWPRSRAMGGRRMRP